MQLDIDMNIYKQVKQLISDIKCIRLLKKTLNGRAINMTIETNGYEDASKVYETLRSLSLTANCATITITGTQTKKLRVSDLIETNHYVSHEQPSDGMFSGGKTKYGMTTQEHLDASVQRFRENTARINRK